MGINKISQKTTMPLKLVSLLVASAVGLTIYLNNVDSTSRLALSKSVKNEQAIEKIMELLRENDKQNDKVNAMAEDIKTIKETIL